MPSPTRVVSEISGRLRLGFTRRSAAAVDAEAPGAVNEPPEIDFVAYARDRILSGRLRLDADRVSDLLNDHVEYELADVFVEDLETGWGREVAKLVLRREELLFVHAPGPRGNVAQRRRTRQHPILATAGRYCVRGYVHTLPGGDPLMDLNRRKTMVALTDAVVEFTAGGSPTERRATVLIMNRESLDSISLGRDEDVARLAMPPMAAGPLLKDFTGDLLT